MKRLLLHFSLLLALVLSLPSGRAQDGGDNPPAAGSRQTPDAEATNAKVAAAAVSQPAVAARQPDFLEHMVDSVLVRFDVRNSGNSPIRYAISALFIVVAFLLRRIVSRVVFGILRRFARQTKTMLDDQLFDALESPTAVLVMVAGIVAALKVLKLSPSSDDALRYGSTIAFSLVIFWGLLRALNALLDHAQTVAKERQMNVAAFMPWIKKSVVAIFIIFGVLLVVQSLGYDVKALLAGLGIGGLAFALAAQDTLANLFGSIVVAIDQPFKLGEFVKIGSFLGGVEDIGLRSTKLRSLDKSLVVIPNKTVASENITNLSRFTQRRAELVIGLTYDTPREQMAGIVEDFRKIVLADDYVDPGSVLIYFRDFSASSLDIWVVYVTKDGDFKKHMETRQRFNLEFMRVVEERGLSFAFPTQTIEFAGEIARKMAERPTGPSA